MSITAHTLQQLLALADSALQFFGHAQFRTVDPEVRGAFRIAADMRALLLRAVYNHGVAHPETVAAASSDLPATLSYGALLVNFDGEAPELLARELLHRDQALGGLLQQMITPATDRELQGLLLSFGLLVQRDVEIWKRLARRLIAR